MEDELKWRETWAPMIEGCKKTLVKKWFALEPEDICSIVDLQISKAYAIAKRKKLQTFILKPKDIKLFSERAIIKAIVKAPGVERIFVQEDGKKKKQIVFHGCASLDKPLAHDDEEGSSLVELLMAPGPTCEEIEDHEAKLRWQKQKVLEHITPRTYNQLLFEFEHHCVTQTNFNLINKIKEKLKNEQY